MSHLSTIDKTQSWLAARPRPALPVSGFQQQQAATSTLDCRQVPVPIANSQPINQLWNEVQAFRPPSGVRETWRAQRGNGPGTVLAIGAANPANCCMPQDEFPYFIFFSKGGWIFIETKHKAS